ncbi:ferrous iron transport protein B [Aestuariirhabdus sp. Z084]|uniref:ferrous iron transport protein B n=1 Tax=Aestuariirhabdus haliotis TaxID=2918751 RepID=UPI00201B3E76|nr:ferrous iron transport protein B [Aestuariirhabdus haliotis]MCL6416912.1 ferrous iron transport protein B [Aestuariirhabdus haliotis]MCL6420926.1 ferrous iron transport protein B [Aestuariirhabdus haliotis]
MTKQTIALVGNPNCGKTTLFNGLTGRHQTVGNWPGVTVDRKVGQCRTENQTYDVVDLPGIYSLEQDQLGLDESIARSFLDNDKPDLILNIVDASTLNRQLLLTHQLRDLGIPMLVVVNMIDVAEAHHIRVDLVALSKALGVPVMGAVASKKSSIETVKQALSTATVPVVEDAASELMARHQQVQAWVTLAVTIEQERKTLTERVDGVILNRWFGVPVFLAVMYLLFTFAINVGAVFIDFFDILLGAWLVDGSREILTQVSAPEWLMVLISDGLGGGIQLVGTFIPVIAFLYVGLSVLEGSGYLPRAAFVVDRLMRSIGLPGRAFVPLIVGFGCNVPSVMASRSLHNPYDRMITIAMTPFMSCGARLTVYALFAAALFTSNGQNVVFALYLLGVVMAVLTGWVFRKAFPASQMSSSIMDLPAYHVPTLRNVSTNTWHRLKGFCLDAGKTIILVVVALSFINSWGTDGSFGNENKQNSVLSAVSKVITPVFTPMGIEQDNWPATVGIITGIFAKEAVVGTLDSLYADVAGVTSDEEGDTTLWGSTGEAFSSIGDNARGLLDSLTDPLGISVDSYASAEEAAQEQGVREATLSKMAELFVTPLAAFCYLVFILLYTPCVAVMGALVRESGKHWAWVVIGWSTVLAYATATSLYQVGTFMQHPLFSFSWLCGMAVMMYGAFRVLKRAAVSEVKRAGLIPVVALGS